MGGRPNVDAAPTERQNLVGTFNQPPGPLLMTAENPTGWKLEDLARHLADEMLSKTEKLDRLLARETDEAKIDVLEEVRANNLHVIASLGVIRTLQLASMHLFDGLGRDQGPTGQPRVGEPVRVTGANDVEVVPPAA